MRLSVVIPGYNTPDKWWTRCLRSVLAACGEMDEVICVDDGSLQRPTPSVADPRVRFVHLGKNSGQSHARNVGIKLARGEYVTFVDSDDEVLPGLYNQLFQRLTDEKPDLVVFGVRVVWVREKLFKDDVCPEEFCAVLSNARAERLYRNCLLEYPCNKLYRRQMLVDRGLLFPDGLCPGEDTIFNLHVMRTAPIVQTVGKLGYVYYRYDGSSLSRYLPTNLEATRCRANLWKETFDFAHEECTEDENIKSEWDNVWRFNSPIGYRTRYAFAKKHGFSFCKKLVVMLCRKYFYFESVRRWRIKRMYPHVKVWRGGNVA